MKKMEQHNLDDLISAEEREHFLSGLHRYLVWVGEKLPDEVEVDGKKIRLHDLIWRCAHKKQFSEEEKKRLLELVDILEKKEKHDESILQKANLTHEEAKQLYHESASLIRAIIDLRDCESGKLQPIETGAEIRTKVNDARRWLGFLKNIGKDSVV
ncbi:MAG: methyl-accepting chemotaxis protein [Candidatus Methanoperedenaceae archaeon]|nr:methyl-accepting chemotaxis protein [Candidatus Methanoperedenaceae archaeon]